MSPSPSDAPSWLDREAYPFAHRWLGLLGGHRMHYVDEGKGPTLLFLHGTPTWSFEWRHLIGALREDYRCVAPDMLGMGLSDRPTSVSYTPEAHAQRLEWFVDELELRDLTLVVHDFGGPVGLPLALEPKGPVSRLVVINSWMWSFRGDKAMERLARAAGGAGFRFLYRWANASLRMIMPSAYGDRRKLTPAIHAQYLAVFPDRDSRERVLWAFAKSLLGSSSHFEALWKDREELERLPALILWGMKDSAFRPYLLERWKEVLPQADVVKLPVGHWPHEEDPEAVTVALKSFLARTSG